MRIATANVEILRLPLPRPMLSGSSGGAHAPAVTHINLPVVMITTDDDITGLGFAWNLMGGSSALKAFLNDEIIPLILEEDPLNNERIWHKIYRKFQSVGRAGIVTQAQAAVDLALWDIKGKTAGLPVWKLLGGMRDDAPVYGSDGGWLYMTVDEMLAEFDAYLSQGMMGVKMKVGHADPEVDIERVGEVRRRLGRKVWLAVDANQQWDHDAAVLAGKAFEQLGIAWLEEPLLCEDIAGHARLSATLDIPIALGETLASRFEFFTYLNSNAVDVVQPDVVRTGGITECLKVITLANTSGRSIAPHHMMEVSIQLVCGAMSAGPIEYMPWIASAFSEAPRIHNGRMQAPDEPGLGLTLTNDVIKQYRVI